MSGEEPISGIGPGGRITLAHGGGGTAMRDLIERVFVATFHPEGTPPLEDQARFDLAAFAAHGDRLAFTTDGFVVEPLEFPGGDIGKLAVCGTVNDLAVGGARPVALSAGFIIEEGLELERLRRIVTSMAMEAARAQVPIVTGDTKVVPRGACDGLFITTTGIGVIRPDYQISIAGARPGDVILINGSLGDHGAAILCARGDLALDVTIKSDCAPLHDLAAALLQAVPQVRAMRDATRGGLAGVLTELAEASRVAIGVDEAALPVRSEVAGVCEILGLDPLYLANEGKLVAVVAPEHAEAALEAMRAHPLGVDAAIIGKVAAEGRPGTVTLINRFGGRRAVTMPSGEQLPRIC
ncbi:hydrogenase expression/formation protein HypE [Beijerinckia indica]|uniref:Hydrogenase expression/formation protein HypE n=1 Tax=Beijerinckia indica subsp. indica (strain ATCC 9039 / DSM 1715 / NCIMB 8712) TaxID=395963 RepID=B2IJ43_BEII9|nr:hydrogenase expression/formation protein HypE [Beijerinckia indica]ACB94806.1 hydrogenase expression/formation protein HypE [Beijerinckia indica subsp. indica ATCC 9039]